MEVLRFVFESPANFIGTCILLCFFYAILKVVAIIVVGVADGLGRLHIFEIHNHKAEDVPRQQS